MTTIQHSNWMIYGANGYTAQIIADEALKRGSRPILAGRNAAQIEALASARGLEARSFSVDDAEQMAAALEGVKLVLNCAGPFMYTAEPLIDCCISKGIHYLDITGELDLFERVFQRDSAAKAAGSVVIPGVGFDVIPTDSMAKMLSEKMPDADQLELAFCGEGGASPGTTKTILEMLPEKCRIRRAGRITRVAVAHRRKRIRFSDRAVWCMSIPWGDISTAYRSTGIPNITVFTAVPRTAALCARILSPLAPLAAWSPLKRRLYRLIEEHVHGPGEKLRNSGCMRVWGEVTNSRNGTSLQATLDTVEGYKFTVHGALLCVEKILAGQAAAGCLTPTEAFGAKLALEVEGSHFQFLE